jgi:hypothetical protein
MMVSGKAKKQDVQFFVKANRAIRVLLSREGDAWTVVSIVRRGDKSMFRSEG